MTGFIIGVILVVGHISKLTTQISLWPLIELVIDAVWILFYLIAANIVIKYVRSWPACGAVVFFGYVALLCYLMDAGIIIMRFMKRNQTPSSSGNESSSPDDRGTAWTTSEPPPRY